jgi:hypothetical protein
MHVLEVEESEKLAGFRDRHMVSTAFLVLGTGRELKGVWGAEAERCGEVN